MEQLAHNDRAILFKRKMPELLSNNLCVFPKNMWLFNINKKRETQENTDAFIKYVRDVHTIMFRYL